VHALMVATEARTPTITKSFEVALTAGVATHKKISYTNPYVSPAHELGRFWSHVLHSGGAPKQRPRCEPKRLPSTYLPLRAKGSP
jgi:hypothetical protein